MKQKIKEFFKKYSPFITIFLLMFVIHCFLDFTGDDIYYQNYLNVTPESYGDGLLGFLKMRYAEWSSRLIIETILVYIVKLPIFVWRILDSFILALIAYSIAYIFTNFSAKNNWIVSAFTLLYPFYECASAGWCATTLNYLWVIGLGLYSLIPIKNALTGKKEKFYSYIFYVASILYACNQEQMCLIILAFYLIFFIYFCAKKQFKPFILIQLLLSFASLALIMLCPGNSLRTTAEATNRYPAFLNFNIFQKAYLGVISTFLYSVYNINQAILIFSIVILVLCFVKKKNIFVKISSIIPVLTCVMFLILRYVNIPLFSNLTLILNTYIQPYEVTFDFNSIIILLISLVFFISEFISFICLFDTKKEKIMFSLIFLAGLASRVMMGFSPTVFASSMRTFIFFDFALIIIMIRIISSFNLKNNQKLKPSQLNVEAGF